MDHQQWSHLGVPRLWADTDDVKGKILQHRLWAAFFYWLWLPTLVLGGGHFLDIVFQLELLPAAVWQKVCAAVLFCLGLLFITWADRDLARIGHGTPSPAKPTRKLVTTGSFALCRHPMHFGYSLAALAVVILYRSPSSLFLCYPVFIGWQHIFLKKEDAILARRFRKEYPPYHTAVPFLLPLATFYRRNKI